MSARPPVIEMNPDWEVVMLPFQIGSGRTVYAGLEAGPGGDARLRLRIFRVRSTGEAVGRAWFGPGADGPPRHAHGGAVAYVLDEAMGACGWMNAYPVVAGKLEFHYLQPTPLETDLHITSRIAAKTAKRIEVTAELRLPDGRICVFGKGEFAILSRAQIKSFNQEKSASDGILKEMKLNWAPDDAD